MHADSIPLKIKINIYSYAGIDKGETKRNNKGSNKE